MWMKKNKIGDGIKDSIVDTDKLREITLDSLRKQREAVSSQLGAYQKMEKQLGVDLFPFIFLANENLLRVIDKTISVMEGVKK